MSRVAPRVHVEAAEVAALEAIAVQLPQDQRVEVGLDDGHVVRGMVSATPTIQVFFDPRGNEGLNAVVQIEDTDGPHLFWLDRVVTVTRLPNPTPPAPGTRLHPRDPNAATPGS